MSGKRTTYRSPGAKNKVWDKAAKIKGKNPDLYRKDPCGNEIYHGSYGKDSEKGWNIDHIKPVSRGGSDDIINLQAMKSTANSSFSNSTNKPSRHDQSS